MQGDDNGPGYPFHEKRCKDVDSSKDNADPDKNTDNAPAKAEHNRLNQKLDENVAPFRPNRLPQANFPGPLCHRNKHDVHNADAAHKQRKRGDTTEQHLNRATRATELLDGFLQCEEFKVFFGDVTLTQGNFELH